MPHFRSRTVRTFLHDKSGMAPERWVLFAGAVAIACVASTHLIDLAARNGALPQVVFRHNDDALLRIARTLPTPSPATAPRPAGTIDYVATASITPNPSEVRLDPCTGLAK